MNWIPTIEAVIAANVLASFIDWYFFGILFHDRYRKRGPGIWRQYKDKKDEVRSLVISTLIQSITSLVFVQACSYLGLTSLIRACAAAGISWVMLPLPILLSYGVFIRMDRMIVFSHSLGWLARLVIAALCVAWLV